MSRTNDLSPPIDSSVELLTLGFDFGPVFGPGEVIASIISLTCSVYDGTDGNPASRLIGSPSIIPSPRTQVASGAIKYQVGSMLAGVIYRLQCVVLTTASNELSLWTHFACTQPN